MICEVQSLGTASVAEVPFGQVMAETPSVNEATVGGVRKISVGACSLQGERKSTWAAPPPKTNRRPGSWSAESTIPRNVGVEPKGPDQSGVPNVSQESAVIAMVPFVWTEIAGSLAPSSRSSGVLEKLTAPFTVPLTLEALTYVAGAVTATRAIAAAAKVSITAVAIRRCEGALYRVNHQRVFICFWSCRERVEFW